jgi:transglutaminase-like putative cysteine protease
VLNPRAEDSGKIIELRYRVLRKEKSAYLATEANAARYLRPEKLVPFNQTFKTIAEQAVTGKADDIERAKALYDHVLGRMRYDKSGTGWGHGDAMFACDARTGNCTDFHAYFIALARTVGIPARFAIGATIPADKSEGTIEGYHCWAEFFADGRWIPVDISEAWKHPELANYYFGHNPANRFELTKGRDLIVDPAPASGPINFLAYPLLEIDGKTVKPETSFTNPPVFVATNNEEDPGVIGKVSRLEIRKIPPSSSVIAVGTIWPCEAEISTSRVIFPDLSILSSSPWLGSIA